MRILMISDVYFPRVNGVSTSIQTFARGFVDRGHSVTLIAPDYGHAAEPEPFEVIRVPSRKVIIDPEDRMMRMSSIMALTSRLRERGFDVLHIQTPFVAHFAGKELAKRFQRPTVESYHTFFEEYLHHYVRFLPSSWIKFAARRISNWQCNHVDALAVPSQAMLEALRGYGIETPAQVLPTGLKLGAFNGGDGARFRQRHGIPPDRPTALYVGRVVFEKNIAFLIDVIAKVKNYIPDVLFVIAGEGPAEEALSKYAMTRGLEDTVLFVGYLERATELLDCYKAGDAFMFASRTETQGLVLLEAMALGTPVVSTAVMGTREVLRQDKGARIVPEDVDAFAAEVVNVLNDKGLRARLADTGIEYAKTWSEEAFSQRMLGFYEDIVSACNAVPAADNCVG